MKPSSSKAAVLEAAVPLRAKYFDPWNSSSAGHQRPETRVSVSYRDSRNVKSNKQFRAGHAGGQTVLDASGAGDARLETQASVADMLRRPGSMRAAGIARPDSSPQKLAGAARGLTTEEATARRRKAEDDQKEEARGEPRGLFDGCVVYVNGSTHPLISDHKLKRILSEHGARMSIHLARRQVTHVILGRPKTAARGAGGGLAGNKLEREIRRIGGCSVKYVEVDW